ncbi:hypothetical protein [Fluviispira vulneris]|uniref:hypothetical protein n=1 Tax=Fluviispira vulneris TaxID=2763012 RepID=UPI0016458D77|nr:hypothetical protein [Fluviispira vulneris]
MDVSEATNFIKKQNMFIVTFIGYSGAGYEDKTAMLALAKTELEELLISHRLEDTHVCIGATADGIGEIYPLAKSMGFKTLGIVSSEAIKYKESLSNSVDTVIYVKDNSWGGFIPGNPSTLSPTSEVIVNTSDQVIAIGGGAVGRDELLSFIQTGKNWKFYFAEMNHKNTIKTACKKNLPRPIDYSGETYRGLYEKGYFNYSYFP